MSTSEWIAAVIVGLGTAVINKIWNRTSDKKAQDKTDLVSQCETAIATARSVMTQIVLTAKPDATVDWVVQQCKGAVAIQMAKIRTAVADKPWALLLIDSPVVQTLIDKAITEAVKTFVETNVLHHWQASRTEDGTMPPFPARLELPVLKKIAAISPVP